MIKGAQLLYLIQFQWKKSWSFLNNVFDTVDLLVLKGQIAAVWTKISFEGTAKKSTCFVLLNENKCVLFCINIVSEPSTAPVSTLGISHHICFLFLRNLFVCLFAFSPTPPFFPYFLLHLPWNFLVHWNDLFLICSYSL